jgi:hypothetical protein
MPDDDRPCLYVAAVHNEDDVRTFYEIPAALARQVQPADAYETFCELLAHKLTIPSSEEDQ